MIQLVSIRGEIQNTFSTPPKQGVFFLVVDAIGCLCQLRIATWLLQKMVANVCSFSLWCRCTATISRSLVAGKTNRKNMWFLISLQLCYNNNLVVRKTSYNCLQLRYSSSLVVEKTCYSCLQLRYGSSLVAGIINCSCLQLLVSVQLHYNNNLVAGITNCSCLQLGCRSSLVAGKTSFSIFSQLGC